MDTVGAQTKYDDGKDYLDCMDDEHPLGYFNRLSHVEKSRPLFAQVATKGTYVDGESNTDHVR